MGYDNVFKGCIPALMTPCDAKGIPDLDALVAKGKQLINAGMKSVVYCGSMGDWPLLTDEQRQEGVSALINSGIPVIVGNRSPKHFKSFSSFQTCFRKWCCRFNDYTPVSYTHLTLPTSDLV